MANKQDELQSDNLCCGVCMDTYTNPKVLPCCHTFCRGCLEKLALNKQCVDLPEPVCTTTIEPLCCGPLSPADLEGPVNSVDTENEAEDSLVGPLPGEVSSSANDSHDQSHDHEVKARIKCPVCKESHVLKSGGLNELRDDFEIQDRLEQGNVKQSLVNKQFQCALCEDEDVVEYCQNCAGFFCEFCARAHKKQKMYIGHHLVACDELTPERYISPRKTTTCPKHLGVEIIYFCNDCSELMCHKCVISLRDHRAHDFVALEDSDKAHSEKSQRMEQSCAQTLEVFRHHKDYISRVEREFLDSSYTEELKRKINNQFDVYVKILQERRQELLDRVECQKKQIWGEKDYVERTITTIETGINFAGKARKVLNPIERIQMNRQVISRLDKVSNASWQPSNISPPYIFQYTESIEPLSSLGDLMPVSNEDISVRSIENSFVLKDAQVEVSFSIPVPSKPQFQILYGKCQQILDASQVAELAQDDCYNLFFIPRVAGKHVVEVLLAGVSIAKKEFEVAGKPRYGNKVQPGPDWQGEISDGIMQGTVTQVGGATLCRCASLTVQWENEEETSHVWGEEGVFEIELVPN